MSWQFSNGVGTDVEGSSDEELNHSPPPTLMAFGSNNDLKPRTGSWLVVQILATINLAVWIGVVILFWMGLSSLNNLSIVFPAVAILVITLAYLRLYQMPQKKEFRTTVTIPVMNRIVPATLFSRTQSNPQEPNGE